MKGVKPAELQPLTGVNRAGKAGATWAIPFDTGGPEAVQPSVVEHEGPAFISSTVAQAPFGPALLVTQDP
jgi:hypothetical protein